MMTPAVSHKKKGKQDSESFFFFFFPPRLCFRDAFSGSNTTHTRFLELEVHIKLNFPTSKRE